MRICFIDTLGAPYRADSTDHQSMGGTQAAACYLTQELAALGHRVALWTRTDQPGMAKGVECVDTRDLGAADKNFDAVVLMSSVDQLLVAQFKAMFPPATRFVLWIQHAHDQPGPSSLSLPEVRDFWHAFALVSGWQARCYIDAFGLDPARVHIMRNAANPRFDSLFAPDEDVSAAKIGAGADAPVDLAYLSAPYRGLNFAAAIFPLVRARIPQARLHVFSGPPADRPEQQRAEPLFDHLLNMPGVAHVGSIPQSELPQRLKPIAVMLYPNTFAETSCIAVIEALAAGCRIVTSNLGALPETGGCFAVLHEPYAGGDYQPFIRSFADEVCAQIDYLRRNPSASAVLRRQVDYARYNRWSVRVHEWTHLLHRLTGAS